ncbi:hypothetical protein GEV33_007026 [Tenebrio molitor]|uniref:Uncharacterized protein n=1 Tax=Tenebrio molitor TaxID=7067 RepID=A0A8J6LCR6_TENMO|nr:hypothetical protein GEV33_007026 [Tenebrio molitor]
MSESHTNFLTSCVYLANQALTSWHLSHVRRPRPAAAPDAVPETSLKFEGSPFNDSAKVKESVATGYDSRPRVSNRVQEIRDKSADPRHATAAEGPGIGAASVLLSYGPGTRNHPR